MATTSTSSSTLTYDPITTATSLANAYVKGALDANDTAVTAATATATALTKLQSAMTAFESTLTSLTASTTMVAQNATLSDTTIGTATAKSSAAAGSYTFFVEQLATAGQISYGGLTSVTAANSGTLTINQNGSPAFSVDLSAADSDSDGTLTPKEIATAINMNEDNAGIATASVVTINGTAQLVLTSGETGAAGAVTLDASGVTDSTLQTALTDSSNIKQIVTAQNAIVWLGDQTTGTSIEQASNTFTNLSDVSITFKKAQSTGDTPVTVTVASDTATTIANAQSFVDAYNTLKTVIDDLTYTGDSTGSNPGVFAHDSGINALAGRMLTLIRDSSSGLSLANYGIIAARDGSLTLDSAKMTTALARNPTGLDTLIGSNALTKSSGIAGALDTYLDLWSNSTDGQNKNRQASVTALQKTLTDKEARIKTQYNSAYDRYLAQFTKLQQVQAQMSQTTSLFDALFSSDSSS
jgi:flagellar hook-associated protein 2